MFSLYTDLTIIITTTRTYDPAQNHMRAKLGQHNRTDTLGLELSANKTRAVMYTQK